MEEIGGRLRAAREAKLLTLEQAEEETKIRKKYLEALEVGRLADIPGEVYLKGFLRSYGNYLELDGAELVEAYKRASQERAAVVDATQHSALDRRVSGDATVVTLRQPVEPQERKPWEERVAERTEARRRQSQQVRTPQPGRSALAMVLLVALVGVTLYVGWRYLGKGGAKSEPPPTTEAPGVTDPLPDPQPQPEPEPTPPPAPPEPPPVTMARGTGSDVIFTVPASLIEVRIERGPSEVWMRATVDGKVELSGKPPGPVEFKGAKVQVEMGHMDGVSLVVNGQRFETPLSSGPYLLIFNGQP